MAAFVLTGIGGVLFCIVVCWLRQNMPARIVLALVILAAASIWALIGAGAYWGHLQSFSQVEAAETSAPDDTAIS